MNRGIVLCGVCVASFCSMQVVWLSVFAQEDSSFVIWSEDIDMVISQENESLMNDLSSVIQEAEQIVIPSPDVLLQSDSAGWLMSSDVELRSAVRLLFDYGVTKYSEPVSFMAQNPIRRDEAATLFVRFAQHINLYQKNTQSSCVFRDIALAHEDLQDEVQEACEWGLFQWSAWAFMPTDSITNAQAVIVIVRLLDGKKEESSDTHYATAYVDAANRMWLLQGLWMNDVQTWDEPATRWQVALLLARADAYSTD